MSIARSMVLAALLVQGTVIFMVPQLAQAQPNRATPAFKVRKELASPILQITDRRVPRNSGS